MEAKNILIISTSHDVLGNTGRQTGMWLESFASPYYLFIEAGVKITLATPAGGELPVDPKSQSIIVATTRTKRFLKDPEAMEFLLSSKSLQEINAEDYDAVYITGGHGHLWDIVENKTLKTLLESFYNLHK